MFVTTDTPTEPEYKFITDEDLSAYEVWCTPHVVAFNPVPTSPLYHYTTGNGLIEIIKSGELWSTQVACLNDSSELLYPIEFLRTKVREKLKSSIATEVEFLLKNIDAGLTEPKIATEGRFIACFSEDGDDLSQWRAYGGGEGGYAIEFDAQYLRQLPEPHKVTILGKVEYDNSKQSLFFDDVLKKCHSFFSGWVTKKACSRYRRVDFRIPKLLGISCDHVCPLHKASEIFGRARMAAGISFPRRGHSSYAVFTERLDDDAARAVAPHDQRR